MGVHVDLAGDDVEHGVIGVDDERGALDRHELAEQSAFDAENLGDLAVRVGQQGVVEPLGIRELGLLAHRVGTDPDPGRPDRLELLGQIPEVARLLGAAGCHRRRVEEEHDRTVGEQCGQLPHRPGLVRQFEIGDTIASFHVCHAIAGQD